MHWCAKAKAWVCLWASSIHKGCLLSWCKEKESQTKTLFIRRYNLSIVTWSLKVDPLISTSLLPASATEDLHGDKPGWKFSSAREILKKRVSSWGRDQQTQGQHFYFDNFCGTKRSTDGSVDTELYCWCYKRYAVRVGILSIKLKVWKKLEDFSKTE